MAESTGETPQTLSLFQGEFAATTRFDRIAETRKKNSSERNRRIAIRFNELHNDKRIRYDDVLETLSKEFMLEQSTILKILKKKD